MGIGGVKQLLPLVSRQQSKRALLKLDFGVHIEYFLLGGSRLHDRTICERRLRVSLFVKDVCLLVKK